MKFLAIIPARYASTRFPGKPLACLGGKPIIQWVYERVNQVFEHTIVATDDTRILECVENFGGVAVMTSPNHKSGTDRCFEEIKRCFNDIHTDIATLVQPFTPADGLEALQNPNSPKVVVSAQDYALYFSRSVIPFLRGIEPSEWLTHHTFYKHIGLYAYRTSTLEKITSMPQGVLEKAESLEQLRWLEAGFRIKVGYTNVKTIGIDTPQDLEKAQAQLG